VVEQLDPQRFRRLMAREQEEIQRRFRLYRELAHLRSLAAQPAKEEE
jgi:hypothetical protein